MSGRACDYHERNKACRTDPTHEVQLDGRNLKLCDRHIRPEFWPDDLRKKLPGRLRRLVAERLMPSVTQQRGGRA